MQRAEPKKEGSLLADKLKKFSFNRMFDGAKSSSGTRSTGPVF
jgi:hypothetical protein